MLTLTEVRTKAHEYRRLIAQGIDPVVEKKNERIVIPTVPRQHQWHRFEVVI